MAESKLGTEIECVKGKKETVAILGTPTCGFPDPRMVSTISAKLPRSRLPRLSDWVSCLFKRLMVLLVPRDKMDGRLAIHIPCPISLAATWDLAMVNKVDTVLGKETRRRGCHVLLAPTMNFSRSPLGGRNFQGYGEDPFLVGTMSTEMIREIQS
ncbi:glycosyl hydrolase family 3 N terminal domain-containing protein [Aspergillus filifer]